MPYADFHRQAVPQQIAQRLSTTTLPAPTRGIVLSENEAFMQPGGAAIQVNFVSTLRGVKLRGGTARWCALPETTPVISAFEYVSATTQKMFAANAGKLYDVTTGTPTVARAAHSSGNYAATHMANAADNTVWMLATTDAGDPVIRFNGLTWGETTGTPTDGASPITNVPAAGLSYVWKYRNRLYFIERESMNAWYLGIDAVGGALAKIPLAGAAGKGGKLLFGAVWSTDAGDGADDKNCFVTSEGEILVFTGTNPSDAANWRQEGRYSLPAPLGINAHLNIGGDLLILTVDGIVPVSQAVSKESGQLELAMLTRTIRPLWRDTVNARAPASWTAVMWNEYGGVFVAAPGGDPGKQYCFVANSTTVAWAQLTLDATCWIRLRESLFFGTQKGLIMQAECGGYDKDANNNDVPYLATLVGGWETFGATSNQVVWRQARVRFRTGGVQPFQPQVAAAVDYVIALPPPPPVGIDNTAPLEVWDQGAWDDARWDQQGANTVTVRNTRWISIGATGDAHAPIVQVMVGQRRLPKVEMIALATVYETAGVNV